MNELALRDTSITEAEEDGLMLYLLAKKYPRMEQAIVKHSQHIEQMKVEFAKVADTIAEQDKRIKLLAEKQNFNDIEYDENWLTLREIGMMFNPIINQKQMPVLLRNLGIMQKYSNVPMSCYYYKTKEPIAKMIPYKKTGNCIPDYGYHWNAARVIKLVRNKLKAMNLITEFDTLTPPKIWDFINSLVTRPQRPVQQAERIFESQFLYQ